MKKSRALLKMRARKELIGNYAGVFACVLMMMALSGMLSLMPSDLFGNSTGMIGNICYIICSLICSLLSSVLAVGMTRISLNLLRHQRYSLGDLFYGFRHQPNRYIIVAFILTIINTICQIPAYLITRGSLLTAESIGALLPGIAAMLFGMLLNMLLTLSFALVYALLIDHEEYSAIDALKESVRLMRGNRLRLLMLYISFLGWLIMAVLSLFIGMIWLYPYMLVTRTALYLDIIGEPEPAEPYSGDYRNTYHTGQTWRNPNDYDNRNNTWQNNDDFRGQSSWNTTDSSEEPSSWNTTDQQTSHREDSSEQSSRRSHAYDPCAGEDEKQQGNYNPYADADDPASDAETYNPTEE